MEPEPTTDPASPERPVYRKVEHDGESATRLFFVVCDEGWRESIVGERMYEWSADWLLTVLDRQPYAPSHRPDHPEPADG